MKKIYLLLCVLTLASCGEEVQKPQAQLSLQRVEYKALKNFEADNVDELKAGYLEVCNKIMRTRLPFISMAEIKIPTAEYQKICALYNEGADFKQYIKDNFEPYLVKYNENSTAQFTSYYESALNMSKTKDDKYKFAIYDKPNDLIEFDIKDFIPELASKRFVGRIDNGKVVPYFDRKYIEDNGIDATIIGYGDNLADIHIMQIQGSAVATLPDGSKTRIGYADNNGHKFKGIGSVMLEKGLLQPGQSSMGNIRTWLNENPEKAREIMQENRRFIFHRELKARGPIGAMGLPLTDGRSLAVDPKYIPLGALMWLETDAPNETRIEKLVIAQDVGSAIKGPLRGDYFWGSGDEVLDLAGKMNNMGKYFILLPKDSK